jgi:hypothetical protein
MDDRGAAPSGSSLFVRPEELDFFVGDADDGAAGAEDFAVGLYEAVFNSKNVRLSEALTE